MDFNEQNSRFKQLQNIFVNNLLRWAFIEYIM
jgi:hypothetical protein